MHLVRVKEWIQLKADEEALEISAADPNRFKKRGTAMLQEEKMRKRVEKLKPKVREGMRSRLTADRRRSLGTSSGMGGGAWTTIPCPRRAGRRCHRERHSCQGSSKGGKEACKDGTRTINSGWPRNTGTSRSLTTCYICPPTITCQARRSNTNARHGAETTSNGCGKPRHAILYEYSSYCVLKYGGHNADSLHCQFQQNLQHTDSGGRSTTIWCARCRPYKSTTQAGRVQIPPIAADTAWQTSETADVATWTQCRASSTTAKRELQTSAKYGWRIAVCANGRVSRVERGRRGRCILRRVPALLV